MEEFSWFEAGHVALITGASQGFGRAVARQLAARGLRLVITARDAAALEEAASELRERTQVEAIAGDVTTLGLVPLPPLEHLSPAVFQRLFETNAFAPLHLMQHALPLLLRSGGTIVNVSSDAAVNAYPGWGGYGASKAALEHFSRTLAAELDGFGVSILVVDPGSMDTKMHRDAEPDADFAAMPSPEEVAVALMRAIASDRDAYARIELPSLLAVTAPA